MDRLTARGLAPAAAAAALALGGSAGPAAVPTTLLTATSSTLSAGAASIPASVLNLARAATEGSVIKMKLLAAGMLVTAGTLLTGGAARIGEAHAQPPASYPRYDPVAVPPAAPARPGPHWEYKFVNRPQDPHEFEVLLAAQSKDGWEYAGSELFTGEKAVVHKTVFKRSAQAPSLSPYPPPVTKYVPVANESTPSSVYYLPTGNPPPSSAYGAGSKTTDATALLRLESGNASAVAALVAQALNGPDKKDTRASVSADAAGKQVIIRCTPADAAGIVELLGKTNLVTKLELDFAPATKPSNPATPTAGTPTITPALPTDTMTTPVPLPIPKDVPRALAASIATEVAKDAGLSVSVAVYPTGTTLYLSGPADAIEKVRKSLPPVFDALKEKAK
jgi:hypothetical protein